MCRKVLNQCATWAVGINIACSGGLEQIETVHASSSIACTL